jgi:hypothetical protein
VFKSLLSCGPIPLAPLVSHHSSERVYSSPHRNRTAMLAEMGSDNSPLSARQELARSVYASDQSSIDGTSFKLERCYSFRGVQTDSAEAMVSVYSG